MRPSAVPLALVLLASVLPCAPPAQIPLFEDHHRMLPPNFDQTHALALGDVDGDGDLDALVGHLNARFVGEPNQLYRNDGSGIFAVATSPLPATSDNARAIALGDLDGDGDLDAVFGNGANYSTGQQNRLFLNDGSGVFTDATSQLPAFSDTTTSVALGDLDGDGDLDVLIGNHTFFGPDPTRLCLNDGSAGFMDATFQLPAIGNNTAAAALGDVDGDGDLDALIGNGGTFWGTPVQDRLYLNDGSGVFADATAQLPAILDLTTAVALGDVDGDGDLDALVGNGWANQLAQDRLYLNDGAGLFTDATSQLPPILDHTVAVGLGDVDGDGDLDALLGNGGPDRLYLNDGSGQYADAAAQFPESAGGTLSLALGDVDGDGDVDVLFGTAGAIIVGPSEARDRLYLNDGAGVFADANAWHPALLDRTTAAALGDLDGDGDLDALVGNIGDGAFGITGAQGRLYLNDSEGHFTDATSQLPAILTDTRALSLGDVDGDGDLDALIGVAMAQSRLYLNDGSGSFADATLQLPAVAVNTRAVPLGDVDGDGDLDALIGSITGQTRLWANNGSGLFTDATFQLPITFLSNKAAALGDVDADGDLDAFIGSEVNLPGQNRLYLNNGAGSFTNASSQLPFVVARTQAVSLGDVDGDGDLDVLIGTGWNYYEQNRLFLNNGAGMFSDATSQLPAAPDATAAVALGDVDEDGDLDALIGNGPYLWSDGQQNRLYLNDGSGSFTDGTALLPDLPGFTGSLALGDVDGDGDLDLWLGTGGLDRLLLNRTRHLAWRGIPRLGKPLALDLYGPPGGTGFLGIALGTSSISVPPLGTFQLDPGSFAIVFAGALDAQGRASLTVQVPSVASLLGVPVYWQGLVSSPARFTNLEVTTATNL